MPVGYVAGAVGIASGINSLVGGGSNGGFYSGAGQPPTYIPQNQPGADSSYYNIVNQMGAGAQNVPGLVTPFYNSYLSNVQNNPYAALAQTGAQEGLASTIQNTLPQAFGGANNQYGLGGYATQLAQAAPGANQSQIDQLQQYGSQILGTAFDPQSALYNRTQQQVQDQANAINAMYGLNSSPYGAGVAGNTISNFNIDWQNAQLGRQQTGLGAAGSAFGQAGALNTQDLSNFGNLVNVAGQGFNNAYNLNTGAAGQISQYSVAPYNTYQSILGNQAAAAGNVTSGLTNAYGLDQNTLNALSAYLKLGQSATATGQAGGMNAFNQQQAIGQGFGNALSQFQNAPSLSSLFSGGGSNQYNLGYVQANDPYASDLGVGAGPY